MDSYLKKATELKDLFLSTTSTEVKYKKIIELGERLPPMLPLFKIESSLVKGCQSIMHIHGELKEGKVFFQADSDALISKGLAALLIYLYNEETPETILKAPPSFLGDLKIQNILSPSRANGFISLYQKIKTITLALSLDKTI
jgi:cysteine desulfuration protein SufE